ncbi:ABC transporter ATP-binding protein [Thalassoroseus pseudoceratinae]|uniref:ABC transporter ATP-binding protein n=1 Tax=Thalassoroseus pseudoceratinae TaxID=2713176 RepID=UPI001420D5A9|nr:ABC transporter ATP-binding protein [Thalassoroseus pseudoceratinae]
MTIRLDNLTIQAGSFCLENISFEVPAGHYGILMGQTGSGKTTLLEAICGLKSVQSGRIVFGDRDVTNLPPAERGIGFVPQEAALFPTLNVAQHLAFSLSIRRWSRSAIRSRVEELASHLGIKHLLNRMPHGLSGGERQRIALGRALAFRPDVVCFDEPLSAVDETTRENLCDLLRSITRETGVTTLHITHSQTEADRLGDVVFELRDGTIVDQAKRDSTTTR